MQDYSNKTIYLGIDVHKKSYSITAICDGQIIQSARLKGDPETLLNFCKRFFSNARIVSAYEAGFCGFYLHRYLVKNGLENLVVHPASIEVGSRNRVKTDKRDSLKISTQLSAGRLNSIYIPSKEQEYNRLVTRSRNMLVKKRTRTGCQIKSLLYLFGLIAWDNNKKTSANFIQNILTLEFHPDLQFSLRLLCKQWLELTKDIKNVDERLKIQHEDNPLLDIYLSVPGFGLTISKILINEIGDMSQFSSDSKLCSYLGLTPSQNSSGEARRLGHISHQGKPIFRKLLVQSAWIAIRHDECLADYHEKLSIRIGSKRAIIAVARKMLVKLRACIRDNVLYKTKNGETVNKKTGEIKQLSHL